MRILPEIGLLDRCLVRENHCHGAEAGRLPLQPAVVVRRVGVPPTGRRDRSDHEVTARRWCRKDHHLVSGDFPLRRKIFPPLGATTSQGETRADGSDRKGSGHNPPYQTGCRQVQRVCEPLNDDRQVPGMADGLALLAGQPSGCPNLAGPALNAGALSGSIPHSEKP